MIVNNEAKDALASIGKIFTDLGEIIYDVFTNKATTNIGADIITSVTYAFMTVKEVIFKVIRDIADGIQRIIRENKELLTETFVGIVQSLEPAFGSIARLFESVFKTVRETYDKHIRPLFQDVFGGLSEIVGVFLKAFNENILPIFQEAGEKMAVVIDNYVTPAINTLIELFGKIADLLRPLWNDILVPLLDWVAENVIAVLEPVIEFLLDKIVQSVEFMFQQLQSILDILGGVIDFITGVFTGDWSKAWQGICEILSGTWALIKGIFDFAWSYVSLLFKMVYEFISSIFNSIKSFVEMVVNAIWNTIKSVFEGIYNTISSWLNTSWEFIKNVFKSIVNTVSTSASNVANTIANKVTEAYNSVKSWFGRIPDTISNIWNKAIGYLRSIDLYSVGRNIIQGLINGVGSMANAVWRKAKSIARSIGDSIKGFFGINSPSKLMLEYGGYIGQGLYIGLDREQANVLDSAKTLSNSVVNGLNSQDYSMQKQVKLDLFGDVKSAMSELMGSNKQTSTPSGDIVIQIGDKEFARFAIDKINAEQQRVGRTLIAV